MIDSMSRHMDTLRQHFPTNSAPSTSDAASFDPSAASAASASSFSTNFSSNMMTMLQTPSWPSAMRRSGVMRTKSDNDRYDRTQEHRQSASSLFMAAINRGSGGSNMLALDTGDADQPSTSGIQTRLLSVPVTRKQHRSRSWDAAASWAAIRRPRQLSMMMPWAVRLISVSTRSSRSSGAAGGTSRECVHCQLQAQYEMQMMQDELLMQLQELQQQRQQEQQPSTAADNDDSSRPSRKSSRTHSRRIVHPEIIVSAFYDSSVSETSTGTSSSCASTPPQSRSCSENETSADASADTTRHNTMEEQHRPRQPKWRTKRNSLGNPASVISSRFGWPSVRSMTSKSKSSSEGPSAGSESSTSPRTTSASDTDSGDALILPAVTIPMIPSISVTQFFDPSQPPEFLFPDMFGDESATGNWRTNRSHSISTTVPSEPDTLVPWPPSDSENTTNCPSPMNLTPPPSPRPHCESVSSGYVGCSFPFPCISSHCTTAHARSASKSPNGRSAPKPLRQRLSLFCGGKNAVQTASFMSSLDANTPHPRSSSIDIPSLHHCIEKSEDDFDARTSRSRSMDLAAVSPIPHRSPSTAQVITSMIRFDFPLFETDEVGRLLGGHPSCSCDVSKSSPRRLLRATRGY